MRSVLVLVLAGCSIFATEGPAPPPGPTRCNRARTPVAADAMMAATAVIASVVASLEHARASDVIVPAAIGGALGASSTYGAIQVGRCRAAHVLRPMPSLADMPAVM